MRAYCSTKIISTARIALTHARTQVWFMPYVVEELEDLGEGVVLAVDGAGDHEAVPRLAPVEQRGVFLCGP